MAMAEASLSDLTDAKVVGTARKLKHVRPLEDYMRIKGRFMKYRLDPSCADQPGYYEDIVDFLEKYTDFPRYKFYKMLDYEQKKKFAAFLRFIDDMPTQVNVKCTEMDSQFFLVMNDEANVVIIDNTIPEEELGEEDLNARETKSMIGQGKTFGPAHIFDEAYEQLVKLNEEASMHPKKVKRLRAKEIARKEAEIAAKLERGESIEEVSPNIITAYMRKGALVTITIIDYLRQVLGIEEEEEELEDETDEQIAQKKLEDMTKQDHEMVKVKRHAKRKLAESMFAFMSKNELIPHNADVMSSEFVERKSRGRVVQCDENVIYVVIEGSIRLQVTKTKPKVTNRPLYVRNKPSTSKESFFKKTYVGKLTLQRQEETSDFLMEEGDPEVSIKTTTMPLIVMSAGTIIAMQQPCWNVDLSTPDPALVKALQQQQEEAQADAANAEEAATALESYSAPPSLRKESSTTSDPAVSSVRMLSTSGAVKREHGYNIFMHFDTDVTYLHISTLLFKKAMKECPTDAQRDLRDQLGKSHEMIYGRIWSLREWIGGTKVMSLPDIATTEEQQNKERADLRVGGRGGRGAIKIHDQLSPRIREPVEGSFSMEKNMQFHFTKTLTASQSINQEEEKKEDNSFFLTGNQEL